MEDLKKKSTTESDKEIVYSKAIKAGKRIYYLDVKKNRKEEMFLAITESKKIVSADDSQVSFEKHKIFLYKEDFEKFSEGLDEVVKYIKAAIVAANADNRRGSRRNCKCHIRRRDEKTGSRICSFF